MSSQFDALLDFGDSTPKENGTVQQSGAFDPFGDDPFGAKPSIDVKGSAGGDLLADFSFDTVSKNFMYLQQQNLLVVTFSIK